MSDGTNEVKGSRGIVNVTFSVALECLKKGIPMSRKTWLGREKSIYIMAQFLDENSKMTKPYLYMVKDADKFPCDLSCESIFAEDWCDVDLTISGTIIS